MDNLKAVGCVDEVLQTKNARFVIDYLIDLEAVLHHHVAIVLTVPEHFIMTSKVDGLHDIEPVHFVEMQYKLTLA